MNILTTGAWSEALKYIKTIEQMGHKVFFLQQEKDELSCGYEWVEGVIGNGLFLLHPIEKFINLRYIQLTSAGFDRVPLDYIKSHSIKINNARGVYSIPMAEFAIGGILQLYKQSRFFSKNQESREWIKHRNLIELFGKTVAIVGCGSVGNECAKRFKAFGCMVIGCDVSVRADINYDNIINIDNLNEVLKIADIVVLTLPLLDTTYHIINAKNLIFLKNKAILVNIARGAVVDTNALLLAISQKQLAGAVLDVFETEPLPLESPLWQNDNVIVTPHNSFVSDNINQRLSEVILSNLSSFSTK